MSTLLISKVNEIPVIQVGASKISISNKSENASKVGSNKKKGSNRKIGLGKGKKTYTMQIYAVRKEENEKLFDIFYNKRECTITDKFKGVLHVFVDSVDIVDSDSHVGLSIYDITCSIQDVAFTPTTNFEVALSEDITKIEREITTLAEDISRVVKNTNSTIDYFTQALTFTDSILDTIAQNIEKVLAVKTTITGYYSALSARVYRAKRLTQSLIGIVKAPFEFASLLVGATKDNVRLHIYPTLHSPVLPTIQGVSYTDVDRTVALPSDIKEETRVLLGCYLINKTMMLRNMRVIQANTFQTAQEFERIIQNTLELVRQSGYDDETLATRVFTLQSYAGEQRYNDPIVLDVKTPESLMRLVYDAQGNLDNYDQIQSTNNFKDNEGVKGKVILV